MRKSAFISVLLTVLFVLSCTRKESKEALFDRVFEVASQQACMMYDSLDPGMSPKTMDKDGNVVYAPLEWWCSGFFPGTLWKIYEATGDTVFKDRASVLTEALDTLQHLPTSHDIGFMFNCSFGNGYLMTGREDYKEMEIKGASILADRFSPVVGCTRSWDGYPFMVIIDNMMNLEILLTAYEYCGDKRFYDIAVTHANTTLANHFRPDYSSWHGVNYDENTGEVICKKTYQGLSDDSAWSRGQAWGLYGFTYMYRFTKDPAYLEQAEHIADYIIGRLPVDYIPFWDYDAPDIPDDVRDASAAAVQASALIELSAYTSKEKSKKYMEVAEGTLRMLSTPEYLAEPGTNGGFILKHSTGCKPCNAEIDVPLTYADYYYLEALLRWKKTK